MKKLIYTCILAIVTLFFACQPSPTPQTSFDDGPEPPDWLYRQRAYPHGQIDFKAYYSAIKERQAAVAAQSRNNQVHWEYRGPDNVGGRITDIAVHPNNINTIYTGAASGGVFKSTDRGNSWTPIFDDALSLSIGALDVALTDSSTVYVGTGESNAGGGSLTYDGAGVYKTTDGGQSWAHVGLEGIGSIGRLKVDPTNADRAFVAGMGRLFANNSTRGIFRTEDGGQSWEHVLYVSDSTGGVDLAIHPDHPDTVYAALWERIRRPGFRQYGGQTSGIYRSYDGGNSWTLLENGLPQEDMGRIGIAISPSQPNLLYAVINDPIGELIDVYKSFDGGDTWVVAGNSGANTPGYMWWFGRITAHPTIPEKAYLASLDLYETQNGGALWNYISPGVHVDQQALYISPDNPDFMIIGCDGGIYVTENAGQNWDHKNTLPITQFYTCEIDYSQPDRLYGGTQDNGTARVITNQVDGWQRIWGGDGFVVQVDPINNTYVYVESQYGNIRRSVNGGVSYLYAQAGLDPGGRNWKTPYQLDPQDPSILYLGGRKIYKSTNRAEFWEAISPELVSAPGGNNLLYGTFTSISVSPLNSDIIYGGTDNGQLWLTQDGGENWAEVSELLPNRWLTAVVASSNNEASAYVTFSGYQYDEYLAHVWKTDDFGNSWYEISSNLPAVPVSDIIIDPDQENHLYIANDAGVYASYSAGYRWEPLGVGLPNVITTDLDYHPPTQTLLVATYGRSMYSITLPPNDNMETTISGAVYKEDFTPLPGIEIAVETTLPLNTATNGDGYYNIDDVYSGESYTFGPVRNDAAANGVSTFDLILINQHILGVTYLNSIPKHIAADVNFSGTITTLDMIKIRKIILGIDTDFAPSNSWRFIPVSILSEDFSWENGFDEVLNLNDLPVTASENIDFIGIKLGDVNHDAE